MLHALLICCSLVATTLATQQPVVYLASGGIQGVETHTGSEFLGVPFARPPTNDLRWRAPVRPATWTGVLKAQTAKDSCEVTEDCLYLNVYVPAHAKWSHTPLATMVYIHGGGFTSGDSFGGFENGVALFNGTYTAHAHQVIVVSVSYRLGVFGFLGSNELLSRSGADGTGNYGIQDQRMALRWVSENIVKFGGDPARVMIHGCSAGGMSVTNHLAQSRSWGLFNAAAMESGNFLTLADANSMDMAQRSFNQLSQDSGCTGEQDLAACLVAKNESAIRTAGGNLGNWAPVVDGVNLPDFPKALLRKQQIKQAPVILGSTRDELAWLGGPVEFAQYMDLDYHGYVKHLTDSFGERDATRMLELYNASDYPFSRGPCMGDPVESTKCTVYYYLVARIATDQQFTCPTREAARLLSIATNGSAFQYSFQFPNNLDYFDPNLDATTNFIGHCSQRTFEFGNVAWFGTPPLGPEPAHVDMGKLMSKFWANLAKHGNPNGHGIDAVDVKHRWSPYSAAEDTSMLFGDTAAVSGMAKNQKARCDFLTARMPHA